MERERDSLWCLSIFSLLALDGIWVVPRTDLTFKKVGINPPEMVLVDPKVLSEKQQEDFDIIKDRFNNVGIRIHK